MIFKAEATQDILEAVRWYEDRRAGLGRQLALSFQRVFDQIQRMPELHRVVHGNVRRAVLRDYPYCVYYRIDPGEVVILAVMHSKRDPQLWKSRD